MSALALIARRRGVAVSGCDSDIRGAADVVNAGARVVQGHDPSHVSGARAVVFTAAVPPHHPELEAARRAGIPVITRADALQAVVAKGRTLAIAGTHGKTTTTVMATEALAAAGLHPTGIAGGRVPAWGGNARFDGDQLFVVEADEYARSFLSLKPTVAVITNIEPDHMEIYGTLDALYDAFVQFASGAARVLINADDHGAQRVGERLSVPVWRVGTSRHHDIFISYAGPHTSAAILTLPDRSTVELSLRVPGRHNVRNAAMALGAALALGGDREKAVAGLSAFSGVGRRFEQLGEANGITVIDDYAHHPTELEATLAAARERFPNARIVAVFQPHLFSRTQMLALDFGEALAKADFAVVTDVYPAREKPIPGVTGELVANAARDAGVAVRWVPERRHLGRAVAAWVVPGDVVITLGAGDITDVGPELLRRLRGEAA